ncbi:hypothetical protein [Candidatus Endomicrobiellum devescovinae]|uniref:hypothetical protein n=1 Tax=Candidatus Endomicrobiellum devescovinae TaxID=3242322 RepID=UPI0028190270|nr:hypothetical protein [Endomicrobium sp.]
MLLSKDEAKQIKGGTDISGVEWHGSYCLCDYGWGEDAICGVPCHAYNCARAFPELGIPW